MADYTEVTVEQYGKTMVVVKYINEEGVLSKASVRKSAVKDGKVETEVLKTAIPIGIDFEHLELKPPTGAQLAQIFRGRGLWTIDDIRGNPTQVRNACLAISNLYVEQVLKLTRG